MDYNLLNEARVSNYLLMPIECRDKFNALYDQVRIFMLAQHGRMSTADVEAKTPTVYRNRLVFIKRFLYSNNITTYGENRDCKFYYTPEEAEVVHRLEAQIYKHLGPVAHTKENMLEKLEDVPLLDDSGSVVMQGNKPALLGFAYNDALCQEDFANQYFSGKIEHTTPINSLIQQLIASGRFNCSHYDALEEYFTEHLHGLSTTLQRQRAGESIQDIYGNVIKDIPDVGEFKLKSDHVTKYRSKRVREAEAAAKQLTPENKETLKRNPQIVYMFFSIYYIPLLAERFIKGIPSLISTLGVDTEEYMDAIDNRPDFFEDKLFTYLTFSDVVDIHAFEARMTTERAKIKRNRDIMINPRSTESLDKEYNDVELELILLLIRFVDYILAITTEFKTHIDEYMFSVGAETPSAVADKYQVSTATAEDLTIEDEEPVRPTAKRPEIEQSKATAEDLSFE